MTRTILVAALAMAAGAAVGFLLCRIVMRRIVAEGNGRIKGEQKSGKDSTK